MLHHRKDILYNCVLQTWWRQYGEQCVGWLSTTFWPYAIGNVNLIKAEVPWCRSKFLVLRRKDVGSHFHNSEIWS